MLIKCADFFVDGAASFAKNFKIPTVVIGLTIVAFGTSAPELAISFSSHLSGNTDMLFGNVLGSNIANILMILGVAILIVPFKIENDVIRKEVPILLLITTGASVLFMDSLFLYAPYNGFCRADGIVMLLFFSIFIYYLISILRNKDSKDKPIETPKYKLSMSNFLMLAGLGGIILGSNLVVDNLAAFAEAIGISQKIISVTIISIGTSLPELVTTVVAAKKGENSMAIGNIVGSNIFNIAIVLGLPTLILGEAVTTAFGIVDIAFLLFSVVLLWIFTASDRKLRRLEGAIFVAIYCLYVGYIFVL
jgi:cation:H+ antiporter